MRRLLLIAYLSIAAGATAAEYPAQIEFNAESFRHMERYFPMATVARGTSVATLPVGEPIAGVDLDAFNTANASTGMVVLHRGALRYEGYFQGATAESRFTSWSVAKSFTSTLVGLALADGRIDSLEDPVTQYLPDLEDTAYADVTIAQALQMSSGVKFSETYADTEADVGKYMSYVRSGRANAYLTTRTERAAPPGTKFNYNSSETQLLGAILDAVLDQSISSYLSERIWQPIGAEDDATWFLDRADGMEATSMGLNARLRDYARFGLLFARDGMVGERRVLPAGWVTQATVPSSPSVRVGNLYPGYPMGYQYQWWVLPSGSFEAQGVFGQFIYIDRTRDLVIAKTSAWPDFWSEDHERAFMAIIAEIAAAIDAEAARS
ncbi:MAG: serine hydrolase [Gammaproteobacteria bacterium]|nr:serine hydrolase [Gammaproteobacteria bacterium]